VTAHYFNTKSLRREKPFGYRTPGRIHPPRPPSRVTGTLDDRFVLHDNEPMRDHPIQPEGRIWFEGNPWPGGHRIKTFRFGASLTPSRNPFRAADMPPRPALALEFELTTADYDEEDNADRDGIGPTDWASRIAWNNYGSCWIGPSQSSATPGIAVCDGTEPFAFDRDEYVFEADPLPVPDIGSVFQTGAFGIYLLGHDAVAGHRIHLHSRNRQGYHVVEWTGRIALAYGGGETFDHAFRARIENVRFDAISLYWFNQERAHAQFGIDLDPGMSHQDIIAPFVADPERFTFVTENPGEGENHTFAVRRW
jgi:hypothetical protein